MSRNQCIYKFITLPLQEHRVKADNSFLLIKQQCHFTSVECCLLLCRRQKRMFPAAEQPIPSSKPRQAAGSAVRAGGSANRLAVFASQASGELWRDKPAPALPRSGSSTLSSNIGSRVTSGMRQFWESPPIKGIRRSQHVSWPSLIVCSCKAAPGMPSLVVLLTAISQCTHSALFGKAA